MKHSLRLAEIALPDAGHVAHRERSDLVARAALGVLEDRRRGAAAVP